MKNKYWVGILYICILMSATGCNIVAEDNSPLKDIAAAAAPLSEYNQEPYIEGRNYYADLRKTKREEYSNPIDAYFLPHIQNASSEAERRELQDTYQVVWKTEFENILLWMEDKCVYQEDKDNLMLYTRSVESLVETTRTVLVTDWLDDYIQPPDSDNRNIWGNGTRSELNQKKAEIYRDASVKLIDDTYIFLKQNYLSEHYE